MVKKEKLIKHPAKFTDILIPEMANMLKEVNNGKVLDPFCGTGKLALIKKYGFNGKIYGNELEEEWISNNEYGVDFITTQDAQFLDYPYEYFDAICTSPTYGNRMSDHHNAKDGSKRITYTHCLGRKLNDENTGQMPFGKKYKDKHILIYEHLYDLIKYNGIFILNIKNHIKNGEEVNVVDFHINTLLNVGFIKEIDMVIEVPCMKFGKNASKRINKEHLIKFRKERLCENTLHRGFSY